MDACSCSGSHWTSLVSGEATRRSFDQTPPGPLETPYSRWWRWKACVGWLSRDLNWLDRFLLHQIAQMMARHQRMPRGPVQPLIPLRHPQLTSLRLTLQLQLLRTMLSPQVHPIPLDYLRLIPRDCVNNQTGFIIIDFFIVCAHHASFIGLSFIWSTP